MVSRAVAEGEVLKATLHQTIFGQDVQNSWHFKALDVTTTDNLLGYVNDLPLDDLIAATSRDLTFVRWTFSDVVPGTKISVDSADIAGPANVGALDADSDVSFEAACISWYTDLRGQGNRGRSYIAGMTHDVLVNGLLTMTETNALGVFAARMIDTFNDGGVGSGEFAFGLWRAHLARVPVVGGQTALNIVNPVIGHTDYKPRYTYDPTNRAVPLNVNAFLPITSYAVRNRARSMRRRGIGVNITRAHRVARDD